MIKNVDDGLLILLAVTCDQQRNAVGPLFYGPWTAALSGWPPSVSPS